MKKILVPTDFSDEADKALNYAKVIAEQFNAEIHFLHVIEPMNTIGSGLFPADPGVDSEIDFFTLKLLEVRRKAIKERALSSTFINVKTSYEVVVGNVFNILREYIVENSVDLVIMGSKGASGLEEIFIGSTAERVVRQVPAPVMVVKDDGTTFAPKKILLPTDGEAGAEDAVAILNLLTGAFGAEALVLHVNTPSNFNTTASSTKLLSEYVSTRAISNATIHSINDLSEEDGILNFAADHGVDMIVMASHARKGVSRLVTGSVASDVVNHASLPVIVAKFK